ncbi:hypothetical protein JAAARDRAFT_63426 [Jaapia argillacea MUCL 33604]|uniref:Uncharacterized protein n=1 Tax=Jaapia argillacea MUCL 33604 TaxID=933084 RepID=A0A067P560_9AGAM|nr:hypothetical protein JAAARDRAFT_63426 [Jaapia argillacea MUCL 33604]
MCYESTWQWENLWLPILKVGSQMMKDNSSTNIFSLLPDTCVESLRMAISLPTTMVASMTPKVEWAVQRLWKMLDRDYHRMRYHRSVIGILEALESLLSPFLKLLADFYSEWLIKLPVSHDEIKHLHDPNTFRMQRAIPQTRIEELCTRLIGFVNSRHCTTEDVVQIAEYDPDCRDVIVRRIEGLLPCDNPRWRKRFGPIYQRLKPQVTPITRIQPCVPEVLVAPSTLIHPFDGTHTTGSNSGESTNHTWVLPQADPMLPASSVVGLGSDPSSFCPTDSLAVRWVSANALLGNDRVYRPIITDPSRGCVKGEIKWIVSAQSDRREGMRIFSFPQAMLPQLHHWKHLHFLAVRMTDANCGCGEPVYWLPDTSLIQTLLIQEDPPSALGLRCRFCAFMAALKSRLRSCGSGS